MTHPCADRDNPGVRSKGLSCTSNPSISGGFASSSRSFGDGQVVGVLEATSLRHISSVGVSRALRLLSQQRV